MQCIFWPWILQALQKIKTLKGTQTTNQTTENIKYLKTSDTDYNYTFQMINIDLQEEKRIKFRIADRSGETVGVPAAKISPTNLNFEFGSKS